MSNVGDGIGEIEKNVGEAPLYDMEETQAKNNTFTL